METRMLLAIHAYAGPWLDDVFRISHALGNQRACMVLVLGVAFVHLLRGERREALTWIAVGLAVWASIELLKAWILRPRPELWPRLVTQGGSSFPSGHAVAGATFYPLLAWDLTRRRRSWFPAALALSVAVAFVVGFGRLYLGLHWPSDVLGGWLLGAALSTAAAAWLRRGITAPERPPS
ncbi:MAG TPA: phosphatase PAP2 family protein [Vicinamibacteria bacterium]